MSSLVIYYHTEAAPQFLQKLKAERIVCCRNHRTFERFGGELIKVGANLFFLRWQTCRDSRRRARNAVKLPLSLQRKLFSTNKNPYFCPQETTLQRTPMSL